MQPKIAYLVDENYFSDEDKAAGYLLITTAVSISWPLSLPIICLYKIGQLFSKEK